MESSQLNNSPHPRPPIPTVGYPGGGPWPVGSGSTRWPFTFAFPVLLFERQSNSQTRLIRC